MKFAKTLVIGVSTFALGIGGALAAGTTKDTKKENDPGFNKLDTNNDGYLSRSEARKNPYLAKHFKEADKNGDGKLSRAEYLSVMTKKDLSTLENKVTGNKDKSAASGSSKSK